ncbi:TPD1 protein homolog 1-like [Bidens hawaiensis]|uniref:TPD1 protein homolog 1-like n=1 Tax=Bidens hawaiensis TaxID=980011 RepID=UPI00404B831C
MSFIHVIFFSSIVMFIIVVSHFQFPSGGSYSLNKNLHSFNLRDYNINTTSLQESSNTHRKLLFQGSTCTSRDLSISQSKGSTSGIPQYIVQIVNTCVSHSGCAPSNIHLHCGWFASARIVNPRFFKRLSYDDCLVNDGQMLTTGQMISFSYSNSFMYPISLKHATFC